MYFFIYLFLSHGVLFWYFITGLFLVYIVEFHVSVHVIPITIKSLIPIMYPLLPYR